MKAAEFLLLILVLLPVTSNMQTPAELADIWDKKHISYIAPSDVRLAELKTYLAQIKKDGVKVDEVGRSYQGREICQMEFGTGPLKVFLWSQMHGDEPTATSALLDMFDYFQRHRDKQWVKNIASKMTIRAVPMLNPDGAEVYQRRNAQGIDINRDAIDLTSPEANLLKKLRDDWNPAIGFNLHNQQSLTMADHSRLQAAISLLVVYGDAAKTPSEDQDRNTRIASAMIAALNQFIPGHIARYDDEYTATAFGDNFSAWGTPTILVETGALHGKDEMFLVKMNFVAFVTALVSIATGSEQTQDKSPYLTLPHNISGFVADVIFRHAGIVNAASTVPTVADIAAVSERRRASFSPLFKITAVGTLGGLVGLEEYDATGFNVVQRLGTIAPGELGEFEFYKADRVIDWNSPDREKVFPPDAIFSGGRWVKGEGVVPLKRS